MKRLLAVAAAALSCSCQSVSSASAQAAEGTPSQHTSHFFKCMDAVDQSGLKNSQWQACHAAELDRAEKRLTSIEKQRLTAYSDKADELALAFNSWRQFRDRYCSLTASDGSTPNEEENRLECMTLLTLQQAQMLENGI